MLGCSKEQMEQEHLLFFNFIHPDDRKSVIEKTITANIIQKSFSCTYRIIRYDGRTIWIQSNVSVSSIIGIDKPVQIGISYDITLHIQSNIIDADKEKNANLSL